MEESTTDASSNPSTPSATGMQTAAAKWADSVGTAPRRRLHFSLRSLLLVLMLSASTLGLWWDWRPWNIERSIAPEGMGSLFANSPVSREGERVLAYFRGGGIAVIDLASGTTIASKTYPNMKSVVIYPNGALVITDNTQNSSSVAELWSTQNGNTKNFSIDESASGCSLAELPGQKALALGCYRGDLFVWRDSLEEPLAHISGTGDMKDSINAIAFAPDDENEIATVSLDGMVRVWSILPWNLKYERSTGLESAATAEYSPAGKFLLVTGQEGPPTIWNTKTGALVATLSRHKTFAWSATYSPAGDFIATSSPEGLVRIWETATFSCVHECSGHSGDVISASFSPDGKRVASCGADGKIVMWDARTGNSLGEIYDSFGAVKSLYWSPDGNRLVGLLTGEIASLLVLKRRRPEWLWGMAWVPQFWLTLVFGLAVPWSMWRDRRVLPSA